MQQTGKGTNNLENVRVKTMSALVGGILIFDVLWILTVELSTECCMKTLFYYLTVWESNVGSITDGIAI